MEADAGEDGGVIEAVAQSNSIVVAFGADTQRGGSAKGGWVDIKLLDDNVGRKAVGNELDEAGVRDLLVEDGFGGSEVGFELGGFALDGSILSSFVVVALYGSLVAAALGCDEEVHTANLSQNDKDQDKQQYNIAAQQGVGAARSELFFVRWWQ